MAQTRSPDIEQLTWTYGETAPLGSTGPGGTGVINLTLVGTAPKLIVNTIGANGDAVSVPAGGTIQFPDTPLTFASPLTVAISNIGSGPSTVNSIAITGTAFQAKGVPLLPVTI